MAHKQFYKHDAFKLLNPKYIPIWIILYFFKTLTLLPFKWQRKLGSGLGKIAYLILKERRKICKANIAICFNDLSPKEQNLLVKNNFKYLGIGIFESFFAWYASDKRLKKLFIVNNYNNFSNARMDQGTLVLTPHCYSLELCGRFFGQEPFNMLPTFRHLKNPIFNYIIQKQRQKLYKEIFYKNDLKNIVQALNDKLLIWNAADQDFGPKHSVFAPFFQQDAATITSISKLAKLGNANVLPCEYYFDVSLGKYIVNIYPHFENFPQSFEADALRINKFFENIIKKHPEQYFWVHRRFKTQPPNQLLNFYKKDIKKNYLSKLIDSGEIIKTNKFGPKLILNNDYYIKIFTKKSGFSSTIYKSYASRFTNNALKLKALGVTTVEPYLYHIKETKQNVVIYKSLNGTDLRTLLSTNIDNTKNTLLNKFGYYLSKLHDKGIFFRSIHLGNILLTDDNEFALIDIADVRFERFIRFKSGLSISRRLRNLNHMFKDPNDSNFWKTHGKNEFLKIYIANNNFSAKTKNKLFNLDTYQV